MDAIFWAMVYPSAIVNGADFMLTHRISVGRHCVGRFCLLVATSSISLIPVSALMLWSSTPLTFAIAMMSS